MKHKIVILIFLLIAAALPAAAQTMQRGHVHTLSPFAHTTNSRQAQAEKSLAVRQLINTGSPHVPLLLVQFPDRKFSVAVDDAAVHFTQPHQNSKRVIDSRIVIEHGDSQYDMLGRKIPLF